MDEDLGTGSVQIVLDDSAANAGIARLADRIERGLSNAADGVARTIERRINAAVASVSPAEVVFIADTSRVDAALAAMDGGDLAVNVVPDIDRAAFIASVQATLDGLAVQVRVEPDFSLLDARIRAHRAPDIRVDVDPELSTRNITRALSAVSGALGRVGSMVTGALRVGAMGGAFASAAAGAVSLVNALAPAVGILAAAPAAILTSATAMATLRLALSGVGDAFGAALSGDAEKFNEAIENLSPAAQAAAKEVRALAPAFEGLRESVQDAFFEQFEGQITRVANALGPLADSVLPRIAAGFGQAASGVADFLASSAGTARVGQVLEGTESAMAGLSRGLVPLTSGFVTLAGTISDAFGSRVGSALEGVATRLGDFMTRISESGQAVAWVEGAVQVFGQLGSILGNVGSALKSVFAAGGGESLLATLESLTGQMSDFLASARGAQILESIFSTLSAVSGAFGQVIGAVFEIIGALGPTFSALAAAITPVVTLVGDLAGELGTTLAPVFATIGEALSVVVSALADALMPVLPVLVNAFGELVTALAPVAEIIGKALADSITALSPLFTTLAESVGEIAAALVPLIAQLIEGLQPVFEALAPVIAEVVAALVPLVDQLIAALLPVLPPIIDAFLAVVEAVLPLVPLVGQLATALAPLAELLIAIAGPLVQFGAEILSWVAIEIVVPIIQGLVGTIIGIVGAVTETLTGIQGFVTGAIAWFGRLGESIANTVEGAVSSVVSFFQGLPGRVQGALSNFGSLVGRIFTQAKDAAIREATNLLTRAVEILRGLPGQAQRALGNLGSTLASAGRDLIRGLINGIREMAGNVVQAARDVVGNAVSAAKNLLGISSPSKVFRQFGVWTGEGLVDGLNAMQGAVGKAAGKLAAVTAEPFGTGLGDVQTGSVYGSGGGAMTSAYGLGRSALYDAASQTLPAPAGARGRGASQRSLNVAAGAIVVNEVGDGEVTAERVLNRLVAASGRLY